MRIELAYGRDGVALEVPDEHLAGVVVPEWPTVLARPEAAVARALRQPLAGEPLATIARRRVRERVGTRAETPWRRDWRSFRVVVIVSDPTRPCPTRQILGPILAEFRAAAVPPECITILIATGLHAPTVGEAAAELVGPEVAAACRVVNHFGGRGATLKRLGRTKRGTPVVLAREWVDAELRIAIGVVEPHLMAGFSGGRKAVCPGIAGAKTVRAWHSPALLEHPTVLPGRLDGNPEHEEALAVADFAPPDLMVNVTVDREVNLTGVFAGPMRESHAAAVAFLRKHVERPVAAPCDLLVTTNGGWPLDATYYQCQKGLLTGLRVLKPGGTFLFAAACEEGVGGPEFTALCAKYRTLAEFMEAAMAPGAEVVKDQWALENLAKAARHGEILFYSDHLPRAVQADLFVTPVATLEDGLTQALEKHGPGARVLVMPHGPYVLPYVEAT